MRKPARLRLVPPDAASRQAVKALGYPPIGEPELIGLAPEDARHHVHLPGPTGTGKTTLLLNLALADARAGRGLAVFDPKGDLIRDLLARLPASVARRLVLIDPDEQQAPPALNLFDLADDPEAVADQLVGVMAKVWAQYWGPRTDDLARHAVLTLAHVPGATLADLPVLLADPVYRRRVVAGVRRKLGPVGAAGLVAFWAWYDSLSPAQASVQIGPLLSKLRAVLSRRFAAQLFGAGASTFRLSDILNGGILLVRLPPSLGDDTVRLVGSLLLAALLHTAGQRADLDEQDRLDASLILDEAHTFLHLPVGVDDALAQARALRLGLVLAHQHLGQLSGRMAEAIDANARNKVFFSLPPKDARDLAHHMAPYFEPEDLMRRDAYGIVCRLVIDGRDAEPFTLATRPAPPAWPGRADVLRAAARARGLSMADRDAIANARRIGPDRTPAPTQPTQRTPPENPTDPTSGQPADPTRPAGNTLSDPTGPFDPTKADTDGPADRFAPAPMPRQRGNRNPSRPVKGH
ncbi:type IV secretory system conjugative DNA transfer family protein [Paractinoplanes rishiriensis]|uniref:type IV secretory system conjugative DNA transfer family protein n=1 Tax=Paractinoplanes rishiriensis TaxID=1050105 RepID=UPI001EF35449|nr:type IV secretion system DNA-binding domain-containing protein [Actinoplanes rishiriensis]